MITLIITIAFLNSLFNLCMFEINKAITSFTSAMILIEIFYG